MRLCDMRIEWLQLVPLSYLLGDLPMADVIPVLINICLVIADGKLPYGLVLAVPVVIE